MLTDNPLVIIQIAYPVRGQRVQSRAGTANVTIAKIIVGVVLVINQLGASVVNGSRERLWAGEATILPRYVSDLVLRQARKRTISRVVC